MEQHEKQIAGNFLTSCGKLFRYYKQLGESAMRQLEAAELTRTPAAESNSVAVIVNHLRGNMLSRWTNFLTEDGEKPWRNRDGEFEASLDSAEAVWEAWEAGWSCLFRHFEPLGPEDLERIVYIRNDGHTVLEAIHRQLGHYAYHVGQIVYLAKLIRGPAFQSLTIPRGESARYNADKFNRDKGRRHFT